MWLPTPLALGNHPNYLHGPGNVCILSSPPPPTRTPPQPNHWEPQSRGEPTAPLSASRASPRASGGAHNLFTPRSAPIAGLWESPKARGELGASERSRRTEFHVSHGHFGQVRTRQARVKARRCPRRPRVERRRGLESTYPESQAARAGS